MSVRADPFHVRHDLTPTAARDVLLLLRLGSARSGTDLIERARARDLELGRRQSADKVLASLRDLGLVMRAHDRDESIALTSLGLTMGELALRDPALFAEMVHLRHWWLWTPERGGPRFAWAYQAVGSLLWESAPAPLEPDRLVIAIIHAAARELQAASVSFSRSSVLGIQHWLRALSPACIVSGQFRRRAGCPPESLSLTLEAIGRATGRREGLPMHLNSELRRRACRAMLIDEASFDDVLGQAEEAGLVARLSDGAADTVIIRPSPFAALVAGAYP